MAQVSTVRDGTHGALHVLMTNDLASLANCGTGLRYDLTLGAAVRALRVQRLKAAFVSSEVFAHRYDARLVNTTRRQK
jgi:hypothetical protein